MRWLWLAIALLFGLAAGGLVAIWPARPVWVASFPQYVDFAQTQLTPDRLVGIHRMTDRGGLPNPWVYVWDTRTGELLRKDEFPVGNEHGTQIPVTPDLRHAVLKGLTSQKRNQDRPVETLSVLDLNTKQMMIGPLPGFALGTDSVSADGRWLYGYRRVTPNETGPTVLAILELARGGLVHDLSTPPGLTQGMVRFSPDGSSAAASWRGERGQLCLITIIALPSMQEMKRIELPPEREWSSIRTWDGTTLTLFETLPGSEVCYQYRPFEQGGLTAAGADVLLGRLETERLKGQLSSWSAGTGWAVSFHQSINYEKVKNPWHDELRLWIAAKLFGDNNPSQQNRWRVQRYGPPSGNVSYELSNMVGRPIAVFDEGRVLVMTRSRAQGEGQVEAWDLDPRPRWPVAALSGLAVFVVLVLLGKWRLRRKIKPMIP